MKNKQAKTSGLLIAGFIVLVAILGLIAYNMMQPKVITSPSGQTTDSGTIVTTNPTIAVAAHDLQSPGTTVPNSLTYAFTRGGSLVSTPTTCAPGQVLDLLVTNGTAYHSNVVQAITCKVDGFPVDVKMNKNATISENIYNTVGVATDSITTNQSALGNGKSYTLKDEMSADSLTSTQDMVCFLELTSGINATTSPAGAVLSGEGVTPNTKYGSSVPTWYSVVGVNSRVWAYDVAALNTATTKTFTIQLTSDTSKAFTATNRLIKTCYTKEWLKDSPSGNLVYDIATADGTVKSIAQYSKTVYFQ